ncbi:MAG: Hsp20/alpha crystallin family protein [Deltaproteobacteria bacterium]|nr:Hsp20/alpha crystallin family protein [Deltaproteobacteria bacterium]
MFDDVFRGLDLSLFDSGRNTGTFIPSIDIREDEKGVVVKAELPEMDERDIEVNLADNGLTIQGEKKDEKEEKGKGYWHREASYGAFCRFIPLPEGLDMEKVNARFKNGVLTVTLARQEGAKEKGKKISIKTG